MNTKKLSTFITLMFFLVGCSSQAVTPTATQYPTETQTQVPITLTATTSTPIATVDPDSPAGCINLKPVDFNPTEINGFLVLEDTANSIVHVLDPKSNQFIDVDKNGNPLFYPSVFLSPNKKYMLAGSATSDYLIVKAADKEIITNVSTKEPNEWLVPRWLDNQHLTYLSVKEPKQDLIVFNPFTGEQQTIHLDLPNANIEVFTPRVSLVYYFIDPTLKRVIYNTKDGGVVLWDLETNKEMISLSPLEETSFFPYQWSPDGTKFIIPRDSGSISATNNELFMISMEGKLEELTHFSQKYPVASVDLPTWSPDGHRIGFWLKIGDGNSDPRKLRQWLAVLDIDTLETTIYCLADKPQPGGSNGIVWSPDGQQLIANFGSQLNNNLTPILVDLKHQTQAIFSSQGMKVYDWMTP